jgi:hypothetical protein
MKRATLHIGYISVLLMCIACAGRSYSLTIFSASPDGRVVEEVHKIFAVTDSAAYARAATIYLLSLHAYRKMSDNAKPYISKPAKFLLIDDTGKNIDSIIGRQKADLIQKKLETLIN